MILEKLRKPIPLAIVLLAAAGCSRQDNSPAKPQAESKAPSATSACLAEASWIQSPSQPDFQADPASVCAFHQYAWRSFLFLTSPSPVGDLIFETFPSIDDVFGRKASSAAKTLVSANTKRLRSFVPRVNKPARVEPFAGDQQAGSEGVLVSQTNDVTYYEQLLDPTGVGFVKSCDLTVFDCQKQPAAANLRLPAGAIEVKASWVPMSKSHPNANLFYKIKGFQVQRPDGSTYVPDFMALTGFHLVFATKGHPELIWATFEHVANAPDGPCVAGTAPPAPFQGWTFNNVKDTDCTNINQFVKGAVPGSKPPPPVNQVVRVTPFGGGDAENVAAIQSLNASVLAQLGADSVWRNYFLVGSLWTKNGQLPPAAANEAGSLMLANATMETFRQDKNCFDCHTNATASGPAAPPFLVSHAFPFQGSAKPSCAYTSTLPKACAATQPAPAPPAK